MRPLLAVRTRALAVGLALAVITAGCGGSTTAAAPTDTATTATAVEVLSSAGFTNVVGTIGGEGTEIYAVRGEDEDVQVTLQPDTDGLRGEYEGVSELTDGIDFAVQRTGYRALSVVVFDGDRAAIVSLIPDESDQAPSLTEDEAVDLAVRLLETN